MHFFGLIGTVMVLAGLIISIYIGYDKLFINKSGRLITERPLFYISLVTMLMGLIFFIAGFLGELILRSKSNTENYSIVEKTNWPIMYSADKNFEVWSKEPFDNETIQEVHRLKKELNSSDFNDIFYKDLEFGTGGMRGIMGTGPNRINKYSFSTMLF